MPQRFHCFPSKWRISLLKDNTESQVRDQVKVQCFPTHEISACAIQSRDFWQPFWTWQVWRKGALKVTFPYKEITLSPSFTTRRVEMSRKEPFAQSLCRHSRVLHQDLAPWGHFGKCLWALSKDHVVAAGNSALEKLPQISVISGVLFDNVIFLLIWRNAIFLEHVA